MAKPTNPDPTLADLPAANSRQDGRTAFGTERQAFVESSDQGSGWTDALDDFDLGDEVGSAVASTSGQPVAEPVESADALTAAMAVDPVVAPTAQAGTLPSDPIERAENARLSAAASRNHAAVCCVASPACLGWVRSLSQGTSLRPARDFSF